MKATLYKKLSNKQTTIELAAGNTIKEALPDLDLENAIIVINGRIEKTEYRLKENDIITIRLTPAAATALTVTAIVVGVAALGVGIYSGVKAYQAKKEAEKAQEELEKVKKLTNKSDIDNRPFLRGASNTQATGNSQPYIIGRHFFTPYLLSKPFYQLTGTDGANQYTYTTLECGFNKQILQTVAIDDIIIKKFNDSTPQEGAYSIDAGIFAEDGKIEIAQDGALLTDLPALNYKTESTACNDEIPHDSDVEAGTQEYLTYTLNPYAKDVDIAIMFPYGLYAYNDNNDKIETQLNITPQFSLDGGSTWKSFKFNNNGTQTTLFKRNVSTKELRFVAHKNFTLADYTTLHNNGQKSIYIRVRSNGNKDSMIQNDCYVLFYQSVCFDPDKSTSELVPCRVVEDRERAFCTILGLKLKASKINEDKLKKINIITQGVARTWNGTAWSSTKSETRNPASWALEVLTSDSHPASKYNDSEIDLDSFGDYYDYCENPENDSAEEHFKYQFDWVITQNTKKDDVLSYILDATGAVIYTDIYGRRAIAIDRPQENALAVYNPQNIININNKKTFGRRTDALRIKWVNSNDDLFQEDTYLLMREVDGVPLTLNENSIIKDITVTGITTFDYIVKYARRLMAVEILRPKTTIIEVGNEGIFYTPLSKVLIQDDSLKIGIGNGFVIQDISYSGTVIQKIFIDGKVTFEEGKRYGIIAQCYGASGATPLPLKVSGTGTTDILQVDTYVTTSSDIYPERGCFFSFGELDDDGEFSRITTEYLISQIKRSENGYNLELVNYNEAIYATGTIPTYQSNITQKVTEKAAEIPADFVTKRELDEVIDGLQTGNIPVAKPDAPMLIFGTAERDGITLSCVHNTDGLRNDLRAIVFTLTKSDGSTETVILSGSTGIYYFDRTADGYPEAADLAQWRVTAKAVNIYGKESIESEARPISTDTYGTWNVLPPEKIYAQSANRAANVTWQRKDKTPLGKDIYGISFFDIQISKDSTNWYKPAQGKTGKVSEDDWKDGTGFLRLSGGSWSQSLPLHNQTINLPENTPYYYRVRTRGITDAYVSAWSNPVTAIALATGVGDIISKAIKEAQLGDSSVSNIKIQDGSIVASEKVVANSISTELLNVLAKNKINNFSITGTLEGWTTTGTLEDDASGFKKLRFTSNITSNVFTVQPNEILSFEFGIACPNYTSKSGAFIGLTYGQSFREYRWNFVTNKWIAGTVSNHYAYFIRDYKATTVKYYKTYILGSKVDITDIPAPTATDATYPLYALQLQGSDTTARLRTGFDSITAGTYWELFLPQVYSGKGGKIVAQQIVTPNLAAISAKLGEIEGDTADYKLVMGSGGSAEEGTLLLGATTDASYFRRWKEGGVWKMAIKLATLFVDAVSSKILGIFRVRNSADTATVFEVDPTIKKATVKGEAEVDGESGQGTLRITSATVLGAESRIHFKTSDGQNVQIRHNTYDSYRAPFGLIVERAPDNPQTTYKAFLEVEGDLIGKSDLHVTGLTTLAAVTASSLGGLTPTSSVHGVSVTNGSTGRGVSVANSSTGRGVSVANAGRGLGVYVDNNSDGLGVSVYNSSTGRGVYVANTGSGHGVYVDNTGKGLGVYVYNTSTGSGVYVANTGSGHGVYVDNNSTGRGVYVYNNSTGRGVYVANSSTGSGVYVDNTSNGLGVVVDNTGYGRGVYVDNSSTGSGVYVDNAGNGLGVVVDNNSNGLGVSVTNSSTGSGVYVYNAGSGHGVDVINGSTGHGVSVDNSGNGYGMFATSTSTSSTRKPVAKFIGNGIVIPYFDSGTTVYDNVGQAIDAVCPGARENGQMLYIRWLQAGSPPSQKQQIAVYANGAWR